MKTKMNRLSKIMVAVLTLALALAPITAFAETPANHSNLANITVSKTLKATESGIFPAVTSFDFLLQPVSYTPGPTGSGSIAYTATNLPMPGGTTGPQAITVNGFSSTATGTTQTKTTTTTNITYTQTGVYTYKLTERVPGTTDVLGAVPGSTVAGVTYDSSVYFVDVYVTNVLNDDGTPLLDTSGNVVVNVSAITAWEGTNGPTDPTQPDNGGNPPIPNNPGVNDNGKIGINTPTPTDGTPRNISYPFVNNYETSSLVITKLVTGDLADVNLGFSFTLALVKSSGATETTNYAYQIYSMGSDRAVGGTGASADTVVSGGNGTITNGGSFTLKHNQYIKIVGLPDGEKVTTTEAGTTDYKTTITVQHGEPGTLTTVKTAVTTNKTTGQQTIYTGSGAVNQENFVNNKQSVPSTGVILEVLPYVLLAGIAVIGAVMIFRKRRVND